jgi:hypothetical protein
MQHYRVCRLPHSTRLANMCVVRAPFFLAACPRSYEAYLSSFVTEADLKYLQDAATARRVVELG